MKKLLVGLLSLSSFSLLASQGLNRNFDCKQEDESKATIQIKHTVRGADIELNLDPGLGSQGTIYGKMIGEIIGTSSKSVILFQDNKILLI